MISWQEWESDLLDRERGFERDERLAGDGERGWWAIPLAVIACGAVLGLLIVQVWQ